MNTSSLKHLLYLLIFNSFFSFGQEFTPIVSQFSKKDYNASNQNWAVAQSEDGTLYFGNNQGLLEFDGSLWQLYNIPGNKTVRSLLIKNNRIFVGSFEEFGYFEKNGNGQLIYTSLSAKLHNYKMMNDEIWNILDYNGTIIFQSFTSYFTYKDGVVEGIRCPFTFLFFNIYNNKIYTHTDQLGFSSFDFKTNNFVPVKNKILKSPVISVLTFDQSHALLVTQSDGLFLFDGVNISKFATEADDELKKGEVNRAVISPDGLIVVGTILNGVTAINREGKKRWTLNTSNVLQNNTVLGMFCDRDNNLWLALDKGISLLQLNSSIHYIRSFNPSVGSVYSLSYHAPDLFIGTNQGLYRADLSLSNKSIKNLRLEPKIKGQVWSINSFDNQQICGNNEETYTITPGETQVLSPVKGGICIRKGIIHGKEVLVQGTYTQLCIYEKVKGKWTFNHAVDGFLNPIRYLEIDYTGTIWASHLHQGLYAIQLTPDLHKIEHVTKFKTLDNKHEYPINVFSINNRVVFTDNTAFYTYDDIKKKIVPYDELNKSLGYFSHAYRVCYFNADLYWFIRDGESALVQVKPGAIKLLDVVQYALFLNQTVDDYQNIIPISENECLFTLENGLALYRTHKSSGKALNTKLMIKSIQTSDAESKETVYLPISAKTPSTTPYKRNNIVFTVFYPQFTNLNNIKFRYKLEGLDAVWSDPTASSRKVYNYLPHGEYLLKAQVLTKSGIKLSEVSYSFEVEPPFYLSPAAKIIYALLIMLLAVGLYLYILRLIHVKKEKVRVEQEEIRQKEIEKREQKIIALQKEKLDSELVVKSKELAVSTMTIIKKNEILVTIKEEVIQQKEALGSQYPNKYYDKLIRLLDENLSSEEDWAIFQTNFDRIHENFFRNLHIKYPEFTSNDLRFCAYLRLNSSSKDIAHLMNISLKGVEVARSRIRKKIGLPSTKSLTEFMIEFK
ncbi:MAG: triple tyrosine motif-containing protein [Paludibacter sp.]|nr:triple tyrosine motif-containing protein [Paludibacter sp.]